MTDQWEQAYREMEGCWELATAQVEYLTKRVRELESELALANAEVRATPLAQIEAELRVRELEEGLERLVVGVTRYFNGEPQVPGILEIRDEARRLLGLEVDRGE